MVFQVSKRLGYLLQGVLLVLIHICVYLETHVTVT